MKSPSQANVRAVFFDAVGTLIHPEPPASQVYESIGRRFGSSLSLEIISSRFRTAFQREEEVDFANQLRTNETREHNRWQRIVAEVLDDVDDDAACFEELFAYFARPESWRCDLETEAVLTRLSELGYLLGLASNFDSRLRGIVARLPPLRHLPHLVISSEVGWRKPAPAFFEAIARAVEQPVTSILYVGDDLENDYAGARAAGMKALLCDTESRQSDDGVQRIRTLHETIAYLSHCQPRSEA